MSLFTVNLSVVNHLNWKVLLLRWFLTVTNSREISAVMKSNLHLFPRCSQGFWKISRIKVLPDKKTMSQMRIMELLLPEVSRCCEWAADSPGCSPPPPPSVSWWRAWWGSRSSHTRTGLKYTWKHTAWRQKMKTSKTASFSGWTSSDDDVSGERMWK